MNFDRLESEFDMLGPIINDEKDVPIRPTFADAKIKADTCKTRDTSHLKEKNHESSSSDRRKRDGKTEKQREKSSKNEKHDSSQDRTKSKEKSDKSSTSDKRKSDQSSSKSSNVKSKSHSDSDKSDHSKKSKHSSDKNSNKKNSHKSDSNSKSKHNSSSKHSSDGDKRRKSESRSKSNPDKDRKSSKETSKPSKPKVVEEAPMEFEEELIESFSESDEERIAEECLRIFEEYVPAAKEHVNNFTPSAKVVVAGDPQSGNKKRVAHSTNQLIHRQHSIVLPPDHKSRAVQLMADRYNKVKKFHEARTPPIPIVPARLDPPVSNSSSKIRIAHVPYVSNLLNAKKNLIKPPEVAKPTIVQTISKGATRIAHIPNDKFCDRPGVLEPLASKIPVNIRTKYLNMMIDECLKIYLTVEDGYARAQQEELATSKKCSATPIYKNSGILAVNRLRKEGLESNGIKKCGLNSSGANTISHNKILAGKIGEKASWSIENKYKKDNHFHDEFKGVKFYNNIARWVLSEQELRDNGFPRPHPELSEKGRAIIYTKNTRQKPQKGNIRWCCRCKKEYVVDKKGVAIVKEECIYHPNNKYRFRGDVKYQCCSQDGTSDGCLSAPCHVYEYVDHNDLRGFVKTLSKDDDFDESIEHAIYALDCEMCYTTNGLDLTRVTVIDSSCKVVYESLVKPLYPIIDYNTRYSGLTEEIMGDCTTTLLEVQATFLHMFSNKTVLVGHSLESDFKALKLIHDTIVDTSVLFPHKMGPPYKRALRNLSSEYLKKIIQNSVDGHDSAEDALVCMELLIWKLKEELKIR